MTFKEIQDDALDRLQYSLVNPTTEPRSRIKRYINFWHRRILSEDRFTRLRDTRLPLVTVANQFQYGCPPVFDHIDRIYDVATNNPPLTPKPVEWLRGITTAETSTGTPRHYIPLGLRPLYRLPVSTGTGIWAASSSTADTASSQVVRLEGVRVGGYPFAAGPTTLSGTARVQIGSRTDFVDALKLYLSAAAAGDISFYDASIGGNLLGVIPIGLTFSRFWVIQLWPVPSAAITYQMDGKLTLPTMVQDTDEPLFPVDYHQILSTAAIYQELQDYKKQLAQSDRIRKNDLEPMLAQMLAWLVDSPNYYVTPGRVQEVYGSNLGGWFPTGRW